MSIQKGDIYGFVGKNGAGKTTLIRIISGLILEEKGLLTRGFKKKFREREPWQFGLEDFE